MQESREHIKTRMLKNAARTWGYTETEPESSFDPLVSMLLTACSIEVEKISGEIQSSRARVLERLVQLLSPDAFTAAVPAHAVATATPLETTFCLTDNEQFYINKKFPAQSGQGEPVARDIFFSPSGSFRLNRAAIRFMATGDTLYRVHESITKEPVAQAAYGRSLPQNSLWLAIDQPEVSLKNTQFYFYLKSETYKELFYHQLPKATWYRNEHAMRHTPGMMFDTGGDKSLDELLIRNESITGRIKKQVNALYAPGFVTLLDEKDLAVGEDTGLLWSAINEVFTGDSVQALLRMEPLRWICIDFPQTVPSDVLQDVVCVMNSFPVINRRIHTITHRLQDIINIIPLYTAETFADLEEVTNEEGSLLNTRQTTETGAENTTILLRQGGVGRFDERDAASVVNHVVQLLQDETVAFSALGSDFMNQEMKQVQQTINKLEQRLVSGQQVKEQVPYLMVRNNGKTPWQNIFLKYWSTCGADANHIRSGSRLKQYKGAYVQHHQAVLVTTTQGGRNKMGATESIDAYKSALLSRDRIITTEDIKAFCKYQLGKRVNDIIVRKGVMIHPDQQAGYMKTVDVVLQIDRKEFELMKENGEISFWKENLTIMLKEKSVTLLPYRVFIEESV